MAVDPENAIVLYPEYFDLKVSRASGRRVAKKDAVETPNAHGIYEAVKAMDTTASWNLRNPTRGSGSDRLAECLWRTSSEKRN